MLSNNVYFKSVINTDVENLDVLVNIIDIDFEYVYGYGYGGLNYFDVFGFDGTCNGYMIYGIGNNNYGYNYGYGYEITGNILSYDSIKTVEVNIIPPLGYENEEFVVYCYPIKNVFLASSNKQITSRKKASFKIFVKNIDYYRTTLMSNSKIYSLNNFEKDIITYLNKKILNNDDELVLLFLISGYNDNDRQVNFSSEIKNKKYVKNINFKIDVL